MTRLEELALVARCLAGDDRRAFGRLVEATREPLVRFLTGMCGDVSVASDLAQETYVKAWRGLQGWLRTGRFSTWLYSIAINEFRSWARTVRPTSHDLPDSPDDSQVRAIDARMDVRAALRALPDTQRAVALLFYYRDMPVKSIAKIMDMPENTVKSHLHRARATLREILEQ